MSDDATPSPFRRFPYVQLVFCLACLGMCGHLWMRYSYAWEVTPERPAPPATSLNLNDWPDERYCMVRGFQFSWRYKELWGTDGGCRALRAPDAHRVVVLLPDLAPQENDQRSSYVGRFALYGDPDSRILALRTTASRFHPASIAGLVVGAMGCFIFGLYLRRWLRERRATA